jgi:hypothetical protein
MLLVVLSLAFASAQNVAKKSEAANVSPASNAETDSDATTTSPVPEPAVWIHLVGGRRMQVDDVTQTTDGVWYTRGNVSTFLAAASVTRIERVEPPRPDSQAAVVAGSGNWKLTDSARVESFFAGRFKRPLPLTAYGQSELHTRWGLDHRNGMDVGLHPDSVEGKALIKFLMSEQIPFLAFRTSVPGVATGPHIHVGNGSHRLHR